MEKKTYYIVRFYQNHEKEYLADLTGLTLEEALVHCLDPETSSMTCSTEEGLRRLREKGPWFDGYHQVIFADSERYYEE